jgi:hypothetical protein
LITTGCREGGLQNTVTLSLSLVDGQPIPVTLPSGTGTVQVLSGILRGSRIGVECTWVVNMSDGSNPTGTVANCAISPFSTLEVPLDLGGPPGPSGSHIYSFGIQIPSA